MGIIGIEKTSDNTFIDSNLTKKQKKVDNLAEMERVVLEKKAEEDYKKAQIEEVKRLQDVLEQQKQDEIAAKKEEEQAYINSLDPLNNNINPIPVNPVAPLENVIIKESLCLRDIIKMIFGMLFHPVKEMELKPKKYGTMSNGLKMTIILTLINIIFSLFGRFIASFLIKDYNSVTSSYMNGIDINNILLIDYTYSIITAVVISGVFVFVFSLIYYISSFFNNKGVSLGEYLIITNLSFIPFLFGFSLLLPIGSIISKYIGYLFLILTIVYTLICFVSGINRAITFSTNNRKIIYNVFNLSLIFLVISFVIYYVYFSGVIVIANNLNF